MKSVYISVFLLLSFNSIAFSQYYWQSFGNLNEPRMAVEVQPINNHQILVIGGLNNSGNGLTTSEIIDINNGTIIPGPTMNYPHGYCSSVMNKDSDIVVNGGHLLIWKSCTEAVEKYDKKNNKWIHLGNLLLARAEHSSIFIDDSLLLVAGGEEDGGMATYYCEIFNTNSGISRLTGDLPMAMGTPNLQKLSTGEIIILSGRNGRDNSNRTKYIFKFDIPTERWILKDSLLIEVSNPLAINTFSGKLFVGCGVVQEQPLQSSDMIYLENNQNRFDYQNKIRYSRNWSSVTNLNQKMVVISGGYDMYEVPVAESEIYNYENNTLIIGPKNIIPRRHHKTISMTNKDTTRVFAIGGGKAVFEPITLIEELKKNEANSPVITNIVQTCNEYTLTIYDFNGFENIELVDSLTQNIVLASLKFAGNTAIVKLKLTDIKNKGSFNLKIVNSMGFTTFKTDFIDPKGFSLIDEKLLKLNINAYLNADTINLTSNNFYYRGSAWLNEKINFNENFSTKFSFRYLFGINGGCDDKSENGGDGIAFVIQNKNTSVCGGYGGNIGYGSLENALAFEFDTFKNDSSEIIDFKDPNGNHFAIQHSKDIISPLHSPENTISLNANIPKLINGETYTITLDYSADNKTLKIYMDSASTNFKHIANLENFIFSNYINLTNNQAYIGFTSGTGCAAALHQIFDWSICNSRTILEVPDELENNLLISPNPASDYLDIYSNNSGMTYEIYNVLGEKQDIVYPTSTINQEKIDRVYIKNLPTGVYFIKISEKFIKFVKI